MRYKKTSNLERWITLAMVGLFSVGFALFLILKLLAAVEVCQKFYPEIRTASCLLSSRLMVRGSE